MPIDLNLSLDEYIEQKMQMTAKHDCGVCEGQKVQRFLREFVEEDADGEDMTEDFADEQRNAEYPCLGGNTGTFVDVDVHESGDFIGEFDKELCSESAQSNDTDKGDAHFDLRRKITGVFETSGKCTALPSPAHWRTRMRNGYNYNNRKNHSRSNRRFGIVRNFKQNKGGRRGQLSDDQRTGSRSSRKHDADPTPNFKIKCAGEFVERITKLSPNHTVYNNLTEKASDMLNGENAKQSSTYFNNNEHVKAILGINESITKEMLPIMASKFLDYLKMDVQSVQSVHKPVYDMKVQNDIHKLQGKPLMYKCPGGEVVSSDGTGINCVITPRASGISLNCRFA